MKARVSSITLILFLVGVVVFITRISIGQEEIALIFHDEKRLKEEKERPPWDTPKSRFSEMPSAFGEWQKKIRTPEDRSAPEYAPDYLIKAFRNSTSDTRAFRTEAIQFTERGPGNIAGRTRGLIISKLDSSNNTWFAGSASGGIWKTTDGGFTWTEKSIALPNLSISSLVSPDSFPKLILAGTGEPFCGFPSVDGHGVFKSSDGGETWKQFIDPSVYPDLKNISRMIIHPLDSNIIIVAGENSFYESSFRSSIYRTTNGGVSWNRVYTSTSFRIQDLDYDPNNFGTQYASVNGIGVIKSLDSGATWTNSSLGLNVAGRIELDVSNVNSNRLWASAEGSLSGTGSDLYVSNNAGQSWQLLVEPGNTSNPDFLNGQGCYDNIIMAHPFDENVVYVGGVDLWKFTLDSFDGPSVDFVSVEEDRTTQFMTFINFGASFFNGQLETGSADSLVNVELRFGQGNQLAHRFTVGTQGSGVPDADYVFEDYVEVPFQAWDVDNNQQLMVSFRDQSEDGKWNLISENTEGDPSLHSREYVFIHLERYADSVSQNIAKNGGQTSSQLYFMWPVLSNATFDDSNLPESNLKISIETLSSGIRNTFKISESRNSTSESINVNTQVPEREFDGIHPDHHNLIPIVDTTDNTFRILNANDGGVYLSIKSSDPGTDDEAFEYRSFGYNTTQFYSADKAPGEDRYVGGMQDNGSQISFAGQTASDTTKYKFANGGDGFEALWNKRNPDLIITSSQNNGFQRSTNGGRFWSPASFNDDGPFYSKISNSKTKPDKLFALGELGVWISSDFGENWDLSPIESSRWQINNFSPYVEVSNADDDIVWAGSGLTQSNRLFVSLNGGDSFEEVSVYDGETLGTISGLSLDPVEPNTAYALFSFAGRPKIIKTQDLGETWVDITGFEGNTTSDRGFPDVAVFSLLVFNYDNKRLWAGTEIGIYESLDGGASWSKLDSNLPAVSIFDFKIVDDQIVVATFGRGIWTATIPEVLEETVFSPFIEQAYVTPTGPVAIDVEFYANFDSTLILLNSSEKSVLLNNEIGTITTQISNPLIDDEVSFQIISYLDGKDFESDNIRSLIFEPNPIADGYKSNFTSNIQNNYIGGGLQVGTTSGFGDGALQTDHNYPQATELTSVLKTPIEVAETNATIRYRDVAIVETGEPGSSFGDQDFYDYVVVEGTVDGKTWLPLADGYDASYDSLWLQAYNNQEPGTEDMFVDHKIDILETFNPGDIIFVRFRLHSDPLTVGWGWLVDDIYIQTEILSAQDTEVSLEVFPNPIASSANINISVFSENNVLSLISMDGKVILTYPIKDSQANVTLNAEGLNPGVYILRLIHGDGILTRRVLVE